MLLARCCWNGARGDVRLLRLLHLSDHAFFEWGTPPKKIASLAPQNGPSLIGPQEIRLVISFGPKVQGAPAYVASFGRVVRGARFEEREPWSFARYEQIEALYRHAPRVRISCAPPILFDDEDSIVKR